MNKRIRKRILPALVVLSVAATSPMVTFASETAVATETSTVQVSTPAQEVSSQPEAGKTEQTSLAAKNNTQEQATVSGTETPKDTPKAPVTGTTTTAKNTVAKAPAKTPAKSTTVKTAAKTTAKSTTAKNTTAKNTTAKKTTAKKTTVKKTTVKKKVTKKPAYTASELRLMSAIIFCEAGAESYTGKVAVGIVVMNRVHSKLFPNSIKQVIYQRGQFSPVRNGSLARALRLYDKGKFKQKNHLDSIKAAKEVLNGRNYVTINGKKKNMSSYLFFSVYLRNRRLKIGHHMFR